VFVTKLTDAGTRAAFNWAQQAGSAYTDIANAVAVEGTAVYVAGALGATAGFGNMTVTCPPYTDNLGFLAALGNGLLAVAVTNKLLGVDLFPNPAHSRVTVALPPFPGATTATLTLLDALGRAIRTQPAATNARTELDLRGLAPGLYAVRVAAGGSTATRRLGVE
jgi:hypothetical protein